MYGFIYDWFIYHKLHTSPERKVSTRFPTHVIVVTPVRAIILHFYCLTLQQPRAGYHLVSSD